MADPVPLVSTDLLDVCRMLREACAAEGSQKAWGDKNGFTSAFISAVLNAVSAPSPALLRALGLRRVVRYIPIRAA